MREVAAALRSTGAVAWDEDQMRDVEQFDLVYTGKAELKWSETVVQTAGGFTVEGYVVKVPVTVELRVDDVVTFARLANREFHVTKTIAGSHLTSHRYQVKEVTGPNG